MKKCLAAFTSDDPQYPDFLNITQEDNEIVVTLREKKSEDSTCGQTVYTKFSVELFEKLLAEIKNNYVTQEAQHAPEH